MAAVKVLSMQTSTLKVNDEINKNKIKNIIYFGSNFSSKLGAFTATIAVDVYTWPGACLHSEIMYA